MGRLKLDFPEPVIFATELEVRADSINYGGHVGNDRFLSLAQEGKLRVPLFQRPLRWRPDQEAELFDSLLRRFPIGTLLLWERPAPAAIVRFKDHAIDWA